MADGIEVKGLNGESIVFDGVTVAKFKHHGKQETARNPVSTYRETSVQQATKLFGKPKVPAEYQVVVACSSLMSLTVDEAGKPALDELVAALDAARQG